MPVPIIPGSDASAAAAEYSPRATVPMIAPTSVRSSARPSIGPMLPT